MKTKIKNKILNSQEELFSWGIDRGFGKLRNFYWFFAFFVTFPNISHAKKTNQAVYEEAFDQAGGGASLTRASQEGILFANPALMPYGGKFHKWIGAETSLIAGADSVAFAQDMASSGLSSSSSSQDGTESDSSATSTDETSQIVDKIFDTPLHAGFTQSVSYLTNNFGLGSFARFEPDIEARKFGEAGVPDIKATAEAYAGLVAGFATRPVKFFSLGLTAKYLYASEPEIIVDLADQEAISNLSSNASSFADAYGQALGFDAGALLHLQSSWIDLRVAAKVDDLGDTDFTGTQASFKQTIHGGLALTLHNSVDAVHFCADYRDILGAYEEESFKRLYAGVKVLLRNHLGFATGLYQGYPTYGIRLDLFVLKLGLTSYAREFGDSPGANPRRLYVAYFAVGF